MQRNKDMKIVRFGKLTDGREAGLYILRNADGMAAAVTDYGAALVSLAVPDRYGMKRDVVLGHEDVSGYETGHGSIGAVVGRFANRIGNARFVMNGREYELTANNGPNALHGGRDHYIRRLWEARIAFGRISSDEIYRKYAKESLNDSWHRDAQENIDGDAVTFCLDSPDGDQGFPGDLHIEVTYTLTADNALHIDYFAKLREGEGGPVSTPLNLTNHSYFNLNGQDSGSVYGQIVQINADRFTPNDEFSLPTGELRSVEGTPMDFREPKMIGRDIGADDIQLEIGCGYDHNFVLNGEAVPKEDGRADGMCEYRQAASLYSEDSGILMKVLTDLPGMQLYSGNHLNGEPGKDCFSYSPGAGVCFETQFWPDAVNREDFPGGVLRPGEEFRSRTTYAFSTK